MPGRGYILVGLTGSLLPVLAADPFPGGMPPAQPIISSRSFEAADFGARGDGKTVNTDAFVRAIVAIRDAGGGHLIIAKGVYLTQRLDLCSGLDLHLETGAALVFSPREPVSDGSGRCPPLLWGRDLHDVMISGAGMINGGGDSWWAAALARRQAHLPEPDRPNLIEFDRCQRVGIEGIALTHAPHYNVVPLRCRDVTIDRTSIFNPADDNFGTEGMSPAEIRRRLLRQYADDAPNTDGIDPTLSQRVLIARCRIDTGDDCIAISTDGFTSGMTEGILITDCVFLHGHGCSIGSETNGGGVRHVRVQRCRFEGTKVGVNLKSGRDRGGLAEDIVYADLRMVHVGEAIVITSHYPDIGASIYYRPYEKAGSIALADGGHEAPLPLTATTPRWRDITIRDVTATCLWEAGLILGLPEMPVEHVLLDHVTLAAPEGLRISYARDIALRDVQVRAARGSPLIISDTVEGLREQ